MNTDISSIGSYMPPATANPAAVAPAMGQPKPAVSNNTRSGTDAQGTETTTRVGAGATVQKSNTISTAEAAATQAAEQRANSRKAQEERAELEAALQKLNQHMRENARDIEFSVDEVTDRTVITVRQSETGEIIRQIPSDGLLEFAHQVEMQLEDPKGLLFNSET
jgi:flagellar protein FlaG